MSSCWWKPPVYRLLSSNPWGPKGIPGLDWANPYRPGVNEPRTADLVAKPSSFADIGFGFGLPCCALRTSPSPTSQALTWTPGRPVQVEGGTHLFDTDLYEYSGTLAKRKMQNFTIEILLFSELNYLILLNTNFAAIDRVWYMGIWYISCDMW